MVVDLPITHGDFLWLQGGAPPRYKLVFNPHEL